MTNRTCSIDGCIGKHRAKGFCYAHYMRLWRYGNTDGRPANPNGWVSSTGYRHYSGVHHPMSYANGSVAEHRRVLYDFIGVGPHRCHWCDQPINWNSPMPHRLEPDHLNEDKLDNRADNLVPSCHSCNIKRNREHDPVTGNLLPRRR